MNLERIITGTKKYFSDSTAVAAINTPAYALLEVGVAKMSHDYSFNARMWAAGLAYCGIGALIGLGRDYSQRKIGITEHTRGALPKLHDAVYSGATTLVVNPFFYYILGSRDFQEIAVGSLAGAAFSALIGAPLGYAIDWFRDLTGVKPAERIPTWMKRASSRTKKVIAAGLVVASVGLTALVYHVLPENRNQTSPAVEIQSPLLNYTNGHKDSNN